MTLFLNILFVITAVLYMTGRLYEISTITDLATNHLTAEPVVTKPVMMLLICVIAVCCGIIIFSNDKNEKKIRQMPVGIFGIMAGVFFVAGGIVNSINCFKYGGFILYHGMEVLGGIGLALLGVMNIRGESKEKIPVVLTMFIPIGTCMNSILHEVKTLSDTDFLMRSLAGLLALVFLLVLFKMAYAPDKLTKMLLYIAGLINFVFGGIGSLAAVLGSIMTGTVNFPQLLYNVGFIFIGLYSVFIAFFIAPENIRAAEQAPEKPKVPKVKPVVKEEVVQPQPVRQEQDNYYNFDASGNINRQAIRELFAKKDRMENAPQEVAPQEKTAQIYVPYKEEKLPEPTTEKTMIIPVVKEKTAFKADGRVENKKTTVKKTVYKAPK